MLKVVQVMNMPAEQTSYMKLANKNFNLMSDIFLLIAMPYTALIVMLV